MQKKVARAFACASRSSTRGVTSESGPSSNVSATTSPLRGVRNPCDVGAEPSAARKHPRRGDSRVIGDEGAGDKRPVPGRREQRRERRDMKTGARHQKGGAFHWPSAMRKIGIARCRELCERGTIDLSSRRSRNRIDDDHAARNLVIGELAAAPGRDPLIVAGGRPRTPPRP